MFLDDMQIRHDLFRAYATEAGFIVDSAFTAEEAIKKLEKHEYLAACLDHDLAEEHYMGMYASPSTGGTAHSGRAVARWITEHNKPALVWVHSYNPDGAQAIVDILAPSSANVLRAPFGPESIKTFLTILQNDSV